MRVIYVNAKISVIDTLISKDELSLLENYYLKGESIKSLANNVLIVADAGLGTINSTLLTSEYARVNGINVRGIVLNNLIFFDFISIFIFDFLRIFITLVKLD